jgi:Dolichyl-phosphate-mannose-protein mannosyltransferase
VNVAPAEDARPPSAGALEPASRTQERPRGRGRRTLLGAFVFAATLALADGSVAGHRQLGYMRGLADRWLALALNLAAHGVFGNGSEATVFKPPGYPAFLSSLLMLTLGSPPPADAPTRFPNASELAGLAVPLEASYVQRAVRVVYWSHAIVLALTAGLFFLWLSEFVRDSVALAGSLLFGLNPYSVILVGMLHYSLLHLFTLVAACYLLYRALRGPSRAWPMVAAGVAFGIVTLVRPSTLALPPFVFLALLLRSGFSWSRSLRTGALYTAGMILALAPWTARNHAVTGRVIPVNAQLWMNVWAATARPVDIQPNHYRWKALRDRWMVILKRVPAQRLVTNPESVSDNLALEAELRDVSLRNLERRPEVYAQNVLRSFVTFNLRINSVLVKVFQHLQQPGAVIKDLLARRSAGLPSIPRQHGVRRPRPGPHRAGRGRPGPRRPAEGSGPAGAGRRLCVPARRPLAHLDGPHVLLRQAAPALRVRIFLRGPGAPMGLAAGRATPHRRRRPQCPPRIRARPERLGTLDLRP